MIDQVVYYVVSKIGYKKRVRARNCSDWILFYLWQSDDCMVVWLHIYQIESTKWTCHLFRISRTISRQSCLRHQHLSYNIISFCYFRCFPINDHRPPFAAIHFASLLHYIVVYRKVTQKEDVFFIISICMCNTYNSNARDHTIYLLVPLQRNSKCILKFVALNLHARLNSQEQSPRTMLSRVYHEILRWFLAGEIASRCWNVCMMDREKKSKIKPPIKPRTT